MVVAHQTTGCQASLKDKGDYSAFVTCCSSCFWFFHHPQYLHHTLMDKYSWIQVGSSLVALIGVQRPFTAQGPFANIQTLPQKTAVFMYQLHQFMAFHFLTKLVTSLQTKGLCTTVHILPLDANNCTFPAMQHFRPQTCNILRVREYYSMALRETMEKNHCIQSESCHSKILLQKLRGH